MRLRTAVLTVFCFVFAAVLSAFIAGGSATIIEQRSRLAMKIAMEEGGFGWAHVETDGLQVILSGIAPTEADRFRAVTRADAVVDSSRIVDNTDVASIAAMAAPDFSVSMLRNADGISLIGLVPAETDRKALVKTLRGALSDGETVTDMLETADYPSPDGWDMALGFAVKTLQDLPRAKIVVDPGRVQVQTIADSPAEKSRIETSLARRRPTELKLSAEVSAPRPVITPFTLRFLIDENGARFDACSADTEKARDRILAAARAAGAKGTLSCTIGMGTPSPQWADAVVMGIRALSDIGSGVITFSDADVFLSANPGTSPDNFDDAVGELESNLPPVFSLKTELQKKPETKQGQPRFTATLDETGKVMLSGRIPGTRDRNATASLARARFGAKSVHEAMRLDPTLPAGWPMRTLSAVEALAELSHGSVTVTPDLIQVTGVTGNTGASDAISRQLTETLGENTRITLDVRYDRRLDPVLGLPDGNECVARLNAVLAKKKIPFAPGSADIPPDARETIDALAGAMKDCQDFRMEIGGYTDSQGRDEMNIELSQDRARSVLAALMGRRVPTANLSAKGYGDADPIASNDTEEGREANRRISFKLLDETPAGDDTAAKAPSAGTPETAETSAPAAAPEDTQPDAQADDQENEIPEEPSPDAAPMEDLDGENNASAEGTKAPSGAETADQEGTDQEPPSEGTADQTTEAPALQGSPLRTKGAPAENTAPQQNNVQQDNAQTASPAPANGETAPAPDSNEAPDTTTAPAGGPGTASTAPAVEITDAGVAVAGADASPAKPKPRPAGLTHHKKRRK